MIFQSLNEYIDALVDAEEEEELYSDDDDEEATIFILLIPYSSNYSLPKMLL